MFAGKPVALIEDQGGVDFVDELLRSHNSHWLVWNEHKNQKAG